MEKLIEVLKRKFSDINIYDKNDGLFCRFNKDTISMSILTNTDNWLILQYAPTELFDKLSATEDHIVLLGNIQSVINWFSDDKNIIKIYEISLQDLSEHCLHQEPVFFPPCQDCNTKMDEIRRAYDKLKDQESSDKDMIDKIKADIANHLQIMDICDVEKVNGVIVQSELANRKVVLYDSVMQILDKYK